MIDNNRYCVIMAGGIGSRFWPMSTAKCPKQFLDILGTGKTLIQQTYDRFLHLVPKENILVVTNKDYEELVQEQLPDMLPEHIVCEAARRNTAPCISFAAFKIFKENPNASMVVAPSDHLITDQIEFNRICEMAFTHAEETQNLVTMGIKPSRPDTGYGYIKFEDGETEVRRVANFTEKPQLVIAEQFLADGNYYWNSGIFVWTANAIQTAMKNLLPEVYNLFDEANAYFNTSEEEAKLKPVYEACPDISIDFGVMEKAKNVSVVLADFGWSDLGTWGSLYTHLRLDERGNANLSAKTLLVDSDNCLVNLPNNKVAVLQGLNDYIVVESDGVLLVCKKSDEQKVKPIVGELKEKGFI